LPDIGGRHASHLQEERRLNKLSTIIGSYKSAVTKEANKRFSQNNFKWQTSFHDHIIQNEGSLENITNYILLNPARWNEDLENERYRSELSDKERQKLIKEFYKKICF
jgi:hypothetical protein